MSDGYTITRVFDAPRDLVFDMWTTPEHFAYWWGTAAVEVPLDSVFMDARTGGSWRATMIGPDGAWTKDWAGEFLAVDRPNHLELSLTDEPENPQRDVFTVDFEDVEGGTRMTLHQGGGGLTPEEYVFAERGTESFMDAMAERLAELAP